MKNEYDRDEFITYVPPNPWKDSVSHRWKLKTEDDIKVIFEEYTKELKIWHEMWNDFGNNFQTKQKDLGILIMPTFEKLNLFDENKQISFGGGTINPSGWIQNCRDVIFNSQIQSGSELYEILKKYSFRQWGKRYSSSFDEWNTKNPEIYDEILKEIPRLIKYLDLQYTYQEMDKQRKIIRELIVKITEALAKKL